MSGLKYLVVVLLVQTVRCSPIPKRTARNANLQQQQQTYGYPIQYPLYPPIYPGQTFPTNPEPPQFYPNYPIFPQYPPQFGPFYPQYPPQYPSYPFQQNYPDPYSHLPTEIIDVDENGNYLPDSKWDDSLPTIDISSQHTASGNPFFVNPISTQIIENKPIQATITRTFDPNSSVPKVDVQYTDPSNNDNNKNLGSGVLIEATGVENKNEAEESNTEVTTKQAEDEKKDDQGSLFSWG